LVGGVRRPAHAGADDLWKTSTTEETLNTDFNHIFIHRAWKSKPQAKAAF